MSQAILSFVEQLWDLQRGAIVHVQAMADADRLEVNEAFRARYGADVVLSGTQNEIRESIRKVRMA
jgi:hypothetical protein